MGAFLCRSEQQNFKCHTTATSHQKLQGLQLKVVKIEPQEVYELETQQDELVCILSQGRLQVSFPEEFLEMFRRNPFEDLPCGVYLPPFNSGKIKNIGEEGACFYIATTSVPKREYLEKKPVWIRPENVEVFSRGKETYFRTIRNIIGEHFPSYSLICGETINPPGHWSSFPPHKHDNSHFENESEHEEAYFHLFNPPQGWGYQEVYSPDRNIHEVVRIENEDIVVIPYGYHPVVSAPGYTLCYFWVLAGTNRKLKMKEDVLHSWIHDRVPSPGKPYHRIISSIPHPASLGLLAKLESFEPSSMHGQPPVIWDRAEGFQVFDPYGNVFIDFSSGVLIANAGHNHPKINRAILDQVGKGLLSSYIFPNMSRYSFIEALMKHVPAPLSSVLLLSTGSEAIECSIKLAKTAGAKKHPHKTIIVSFENAFHGRTMGAQLAGGIPALKKWIGNLDPTFVQVPFPDGVYSHYLDFSSFEQSLKEQNINPLDVCAVLMETYQGGIVSFAPQVYMNHLRKWCDTHEVLLIMDEVQSGFCRTGKWWGFEHYGIVPDVIVCGKGVSSSLPLSAVIGTKDLLNQYPPGSMSTTHSANPVSCAAGAASIQVLEEERLDLNAQQLEKIIQAKTALFLKTYRPYIRGIYGKGLVYGIHIQDPLTRLPNHLLAKSIVWNCVQKGLLFFAPVGPSGGTIKINPPLCINSEALEEGLSILEKVLAMELNK